MFRPSRLSTLYFWFKSLARRKGIMLYVGLFSLLCFVSYQVYSIVMQIFPEVGMSTVSSCRRPLQNWNGKVFEIPIYPNYVGSNPPHYNIYFRANHTEDRRRLDDSFYNKDKNQKGALILWGTHHRAGTHLAQKIFASVCSKYSLCCLFHPTRTSIDAIRDTLKDENVHIMGHNQWIWNPKEIFGEEIKYRFVHFYREPIRKIISGFHYHRDGTEKWTQKEHLFSQLCNNAIEKSVTRATVHDYCHSIRLCETCCRREHEIALTKEEQRKTLLQSNVVHKYETKDPAEYIFMCNHLGKIPKELSLMQALQQGTVEDGLMSEAAIEYYENKRMMNILMDTKDDPYTLHIENDDFVKDFTGTMKRIVHHILPDLPDGANGDDLMYSLSFYDLDSSPFYRWSMSNWFRTHSYVGKGIAKDEMKTYLMSQKDFVHLYQPIIDAFDKYKEESRHKMLDSI